MGNMSTLTIVKLALQFASSAIEGAESFIPAGRVQTILHVVDAAIQEALSVLNSAVKAQLKLDKDSLEENPVVNEEASEELKDIAVKLKKKAA